MKKTKNSSDIKSEVMNIVLDISKRLAKKQQGALFIIADREKIKGYYRPHYPQVQFLENLPTKGMDAVVEKLAALDGAVILTPEGEMI
ncbi:MAG: hypothetical protein O8C59_00725, partial [Candidatus Methanoperedens sp.]|nr:hypothetical protein [Candidatus Methanoperedens sp.]